MDFHFGFQKSLEKHMGEEMMTTDQWQILIFGWTITVKVIRKTTYLQKQKFFFFFLIYGLFAIIIFENEEMRK